MLYLKGAGEEGGHTNLYQNHLGMYLHKCPKFVAMTQEDRQQTCKDAQMCLAYLHPKVYYSNPHYSDCKKRKAVKCGVRDEYTCQVTVCSNSIWTCVRHKDGPTNTFTIKKTWDEMVQRGWTMGMVTIMPTIPTNIQTPGVC